MTTLPVTFTFIALIAIAITCMTAWIGIYRGKIDVLRGDGDDPQLFWQTRVHGNFIENAPIVALSLGASETLGAASWALWLTVVLFIIGRVMHAKSFDTAMRGVSMTLTQFPAAFLAIWCLYRLYLG